MVRICLGEGGECVDYGFGYWCGWHAACLLAWIGGRAALLGLRVVARLHVGVVALVVVPATGLRAWLKRLVPPGRLEVASLELWLVCIHPVG